MRRLKETGATHESAPIRRCPQETRTTSSAHNQTVFRYPLLLIVVALLAISCGADSESVEIPTEVQLQGVFSVPEDLKGDMLVAEEMRYLVWLPEDYGADRTREWPLIVFLHGSGDPEYNAPYVQSFGLPAVLHADDQPDNFEFVVLSPQAAGGSAWWTGNTVDVLDALVEDVANTYLIDPTRIYLTGLSMGGYGSWFLAMDHSDRFAAMVSTSGSGWRQPVLPPGDVCAMADLPVRAIHGAKDLISDPPPNQAIVARYKAVCDADVFFEVYPDTGHFETYERAYRDPELYDWMLQFTNER